MLAVGNGNAGRSNERDKYAKRALELTDRLTPRERYYIEGYYYSARLEDTQKAMAQGKKTEAIAEIRRGIADAQGPLAISDILIAGGLAVIARRGTADR